MSYPIAQDVNYLSTTNISFVSSFDYKKRFKFSYGENHSIQNQHYDFKKNFIFFIKHKFYFLMGSELCLPI